MTGSAVADGAGAYRVLVPPGDYQAVASAGSYLTATAPARVAEGAPATVDFALTRITGVAAGTGKRLSGSLAEGALTDLVIGNGSIAAAVSLGTQDGQLQGTTVGKVLDMTARGYTDQLDWINLPYASAAQPRGGSAWQQTTVRHNDVRVAESTPSRAVVRATGVSTAFPTLAAVTTYTIEPDRQWIDASTVFTNGGATPVDAWVGDSLDHDGSGQRGLVAGRVITSGLAEYPASEPWIGMTGNDPQAYGLLYDELPGPLIVYSAGNWIMSQIRVTIAAGQSVTLRRRIAVAPAPETPRPRCPSSTACPDRRHPTNRFTIWPVCYVLSPSCYPPRPWRAARACKGSWSRTGFRRSSCRRARPTPPLIAPSS